ncbi:flagellar motor switch protein G [Rubripirellula lacrimiformis]|uniref:Flagellar motor switch protein FliG n=1 Tax=Rubripirellula lacrimiformis TaxID=1930273 RepID=A0A517N6J3_9BACT|nr:FliG C-terminal domain-containing protein [Rubripirellula lacrimiformis]QDT02741.1 flagellar motor switch protein G [Rubripirellula lacrimiformis]
MAGSTQIDATNRDAALRRVAIVLSSLPASVAAKLMGTIDQNSKQTIRRTMATLADVDPLERHRALQAFKVSVQKQPSGGDELGISGDASGGQQDDAFFSQGPETMQRPAILKNQQVQRPADPSSPLAFLGDVEDDRLVELLSGEHAQAVALVLASIAPSHAARVLPRLSPALRSETLSRLGRLAEVPETAASEIASHFRSRLSQIQSSPSPGSTGKRALDAILAAMPGMPENQRSVDPQRSVSAHNAMSEASRYAGHAGRQSMVDPAGAGRPGASGGYRGAVHAEAVDSALSIQLAQHTMGAQSPAGRVPSDQVGASAVPSHSTPAHAAPSHATTSHTAPSNVTPSNRPPTAVGNSDAATPFRTTDEIHDHLLTLSAKELCGALGRVETRDAMLALCGLPNAKAESVLSVLPRDQAKTVRGQMNSLNSLNLRDIDKAKERVAIASLPSNVPGNVMQAATSHQVAAAAA